MLDLKVRGDGSKALNPVSVVTGIVGSLEGSPVLQGFTATHEPIEIKKSLWARWKSLPLHNATELNKAKR